MGRFPWAFTLTYRKKGLRTAYNKPSTCGNAKPWGTFCGIKFLTVMRRNRRTIDALGDDGACFAILPP